MKEIENEIESVEFQIEIVCVSDSEYVSMSVLVNDASLRNEVVNVLDCVNVFENVSDCVNVSGGGRFVNCCSFRYFQIPNVSFWFVTNVITYAVEIPEKALVPIVGNALP